MRYKHKYLYSSFQKWIGKIITRLVRKTLLSITDPSFDANIGWNIISILEKMCFYHATVFILTLNNMNWCKQIVA